MQTYEILEQEYASFAGSRFAVSCNSGTSALHLSLLALGVGAGDEVIVPDFSMAACAFAVSYTGAQPIFADVDLKTYGITFDEVADRVTTNTKAIILVHTYGRLARDTEKIINFARSNGIPVVEDACEAQGAVYKSKADLTCWSFYKNKIISAEEGGMVTSDNADCATRMRYLKNMAFGPEHDYFHEEIGYNYRMPNVMAFMAKNSLSRYNENAVRRREIEEWYDEELGHPLKKRDAVWFYEIPTKNKARVLKNVVGARASFKPISSFPMYGGGLGKPNAEELSESLVLLPVHPGMTRDDVRYNASQV